MLPAGGTGLLNVSHIIEKLHLEPDMVVADLGSGGNGHFVFPLAQKVGDGGLVYAIDIIKNDLDRISKRAQAFNINNIKTIWSNLEVYGATTIDHKLDGALLINVLFQNHKHDTILKEAARLLKHGALLVVVDWRKGVAPFGPLEQNRVSPDTLTSLAHNNNFTLIKEFRAGLFHYGLVLQKI